MLKLNLKGDINKQIINLIDAKGIKHTYIADKLNISKQALHYMLTKKELTVTDLMKICNVIGLDVEVTIDHLKPNISFFVGKEDKDGNIVPLDEDES